MKPLNLTMDAETRKLLKLAAREQKKSKSAVVRDLIRNAATVKEQK